jgi:glycosyltransferase involved in cell wall biosynthesis
LKKILLFSNTSWYLYNFRLPFAKKIRSYGYEAIFVAPEDKYSEKIRQAGFAFYGIDLARHGMNPFSELRTITKLSRLFSDIKPAIVHNFTIKCILYGSIAARLSGIPRIVNSVTGLGYVFIEDSVKAKFVRFFVTRLYRLLFGMRHTAVIFQNPEDQNFFHQQKIVDKERSQLIEGSGVDLARFKPQDSASKTFNILLAGRLIFEKGVREYVEAAKMVKQKYPEIRFQIAGEFDSSQPSAVSAQELQKWQEEGLIEYLGHTDAIEAIMAEAAVVALPSYREGLPRILIEAAAMGKALIASDVPGCRSVVVDGHNGILVPAKNAEEIAKKIIFLYENPEQRKKMGAAGVQIANRFSLDSITDQTALVYKS